MTPHRPAMNNLSDAGVLAGIECPCTAVLAGIECPCTAAFQAAPNRLARPSQRRLLAVPIDLTRQFECRSLIEW